MIATTWASDGSTSKTRNVSSTPTNSWNESLPLPSVFRLSMVQEPLLLIVAFFLFFALTIVYVRMDFAITKDEGSEARMKAAGVCEKVTGHQGGGR